MHDESATSQKSADDLISKLKDILGAEQVLTDEESRDFYSSDLYQAGERCAAVIVPLCSDSLARAVQAITSQGCAVVPRGGGLTYVKGYTPSTGWSVVVDMRKLNRIIELNPDDMYITVEAGVTWKQIYDALQPHGLRLPFLGTFSGAAATVGGGLSNGALFFGTARYGTAAETALGLEVITAEGRVVRTGQLGVRNATKPTYRTFGPDFTGVFTHDSGAFGLKTKAALRLIRAPAETEYLSFGFRSQQDAVAALCEIGRSDLAEEAYVMDPVKTREALSGSDFVSDVKALFKVMGQERNPLRGLRAGIGLAAAGRRFAKHDYHSLHMTCSSRSRAGLMADKNMARAIARRFGGMPLPDSIPRAARAMLFPPLDAMVGPKGERWIGLNAKVAHTDAQTLVARAEAIIAEHKENCDRLGISISRLLAVLLNYSFSYEPVFHWQDSWLPLHQEAPPIKDGRLKEPPANEEARKEVEIMRGKLVALFAELGAASNQIGRTYPYATALHDDTAALLRGVKQHLDPDTLMNPGALELG